MLKFIQRSWPRFLFLLVFISIFIQPRKHIFEKIQRWILWASILVRNFCNLQALIEIDHWTKDVNLLLETQATEKQRNIRNNQKLLEIFTVGKRLHALCFISNIYNQRFLWLVKFLKKLSNMTSLSWNLKQHQENY